MRLTSEQRRWDELARLDPYWAVLPRPEGIGSWNVAEYLETGRDVLAALIRHAEHLGYPQARRSALDFGCGVGRLVRALAEHFDQAVGVDISGEMIAEARRINGGVQNVRFEVNAENDLRTFGDETFDLVHSTIVLQHVAPKEMILAYVDEFVRITRPNGLIAFDIPAHVPPKYRLQPRRRVFTALRRMRIPTAFVYKLVRTYPMPTTFVSSEEVTRFLESRGARLLDVVESTEPSGVQHAAYYATK